MRGLSSLAVTTSQACSAYTRRGPSRVRRRLTHDSLFAVPMLWRCLNRSTDTLDFREDNPG
jgi:hypothetical protein